jgi:hypothetical protein
MQNHVALIVDTVCDFGERIVAAVGAESHLFVVNAVLLPAQVALVDESADGGDFAAVEREQLDAHLHCYVLEGEVSTDEPDSEDFLLFFLDVLLEG